MTTLVTPVVDAPPYAVVAIVGAEDADWDNYLAGRGKPDLYASISRRPAGAVANTDARSQPRSGVVISTQTQSDRKRVRRGGRRKRRWLWWR
jgi:hypothetical protein